VNIHEEGGMSCHGKTSTDLVTQFYKMYVVDNVNFSFTSTKAGFGVPQYRQETLCQKAKLFSTSLGGMTLIRLSGKLEVLAIFVCNLNRRTGRLFTSSWGTQLL
jgi:hypothetical protein